MALGFDVGHLERRGPEKDAFKQTILGLGQIPETSRTVKVVRNAPELLHEAASARSISASRKTRYLVPLN